MGARYSDTEIEVLLTEPKRMPDNHRAKSQLRQKRGHKERELELTGDHGSRFLVILRQGDINSIDFSVILAVFPAGSNTAFRLRRYNGKSHEHTNHLEDETFYDFHIHTATERYQLAGNREDTFAEQTERFSDFNGAIRCLIDDCGFVLPVDAQGTLFGGDQ